MKSVGEGIRTTRPRRSPRYFIYRVALVYLLKLKMRPFDYCDLAKLVHFAGV